MPYYPEYKTNWVKELPQGTCPACESTEVEDNSFTDKKGYHWESVKCEGCRTKWMKSKGFSANKERPKDKPETITTPTRDVILLEEIQALGQRVDDMNEGITKGFKAIKEMLVILQSKK